MGTASAFRRTASSASACIRCDASCSSFGTSRRLGLELASVKTSRGCSLPSERRVNRRRSQQTQPVKSRRFRPHSSLTQPVLRVLRFTLGLWPMSHKRIKFPSHPFRRICALLLRLALSVAIVFKPLHGAARPGQARYVCRVKLSTAVARKVAVIQMRYRAATGKSFDITSGTRSARVSGPTPCSANFAPVAPYRGYIDQTSAREVFETYRRLTATGRRSDEEIITALEAAIQAQNRPRYLSL